VQNRWTRLVVDGKPHPHSFFRDSEETREVEVVAREGKGIIVKSGINKLLVLKSTGSAFYGFDRDAYTALPETWDRILSTEVKSDWTWNTFSNLAEVKSQVGKFDEAWKVAREITTTTFANDNSASVQNTMYKMCDQILAKVPTIQSVDYSLPNKHYFEIGMSSALLSLLYEQVLIVLIDLSWHKGLKNTGKDAEVYAPQSNPNGLIECTVVRKGGKAKL
jgi:urate oxidase